MQENYDIREIEEKVRRALQFESFESHDRKWTVGIHQRVGEIGRSYGFKVWAIKKHHPNANGDEWLYDHHWRVEDGDGNLVQIPLAMEIEWGFNWGPQEENLSYQVRHDFFKLVQSRAQLRVMVFSESKLKAEDLIQLANSSRMSQGGDRYLFAGCPKKGTSLRLVSWEKGKVISDQRCP